MYEELLPIWKKRCKTRGSMDAATEWVFHLNAMGYKFHFIRDDNGEWDCLVNSIMLFTWEQGISE